MYLNFCYILDIVFQLTADLRDFPIHVHTLIVYSMRTDKIGPFNTL